MPTQLYNNSAIYFMCARNFLWAGTEYKMGDTFDQDLGVGRLDMLVRNRWLVAVVDEHADLPRHWRHHVWERSVVSKKLGLINNDRVKSIGGENLYNKFVQQGNASSASAPIDPGKPEMSDSDKLWYAQDEAIRRERVLAEVNDENEAPEDEETEPEALVNPPDAQEVEDPNEDRTITEDDLYDPSEHKVPEVLDYLEDADEEERQRVVDAERQGKNRKMITGD